MLQISKSASLTGAIAAALLAAPAARAASFTYTTLDVPNSITTQISLLADVLNNSDQVVGTTRIGTSTGATEGFLWQNGTFTLYQTAITLTGINNNGVAVGFAATSPGYLTIDTSTGQPTFFADNFSGNLLDVNDSNSIAAQQPTAIGSTIGYVLFQDTETEITVPGSVSTFPTGINNSGTVTGYYSTGSTQPGFIYSGGVFTTVNVPQSANTTPTFITSTGVIGGSFTSTQTLSLAGFTLVGSQYHIYLPNNAAVARVVGIGPAGEVVGTFDDAQIKQHGFIYRNGTYYQIDYPGAATTQVFSVNARGSLAGSYTDTNGTAHPFIAQCASIVSSGCTQ